VFSFFQMMMTTKLMEMTENRFIDNHSSSPSSLIFYKLFTHVKWKVFEMKNILSYLLLSNH